MTMKRMIMIGLSVSLLGACSLHEPTFMNQTKIQLERDAYSATFPTVEVTKDVAQAISVAYSRGGDGPVEVSVSYDPFYKDNNALVATRKLALISENLRKAGIRDIEGEILPAYRSEDRSNTVISFEKYSAHAPEGCDETPGLQRDDVTLDRDYRLGCGLDSMIARQVHNPKDLLGNKGTDYDSDGRRNANIVEIYRSGAPNEELSGETASEGG